MAVAHLVIVDRDDVFGRSLSVLLAVLPSVVVAGSLSIT